MTEERCKEIYQRIKKENPCFFCVQYDNGCQLKGHNCDSTSLRMYYEKSYPEVEPYLKNAYVKELEEDNAKLRKRNSGLAGQKASLERWLGEAKCLIKDLLDCLHSVEYDRLSDLEKAERFLEGLEE